MNIVTIFGILLLILGLVIFCVAEIILYKWIKNFNKIWMGEENEVS